MDSKQRFSDRVEDYVKSRPGYPPALVAFLVERCGLTRESRVADVGSGTGLLARPLLEYGARVVAVEPNREMREAGARQLASFANFTSVDGSAEATTLEAESVDLVVAGQAFHWFDREAARREFGRILVPGGWTALVWNVRKTDESEFLGEYERLLETYGTDYEQVSHRSVSDATLHAFFGGEGFELATMPNEQMLDWEHLVGRLRSSSYIPREGHPDYEPMIAALDKLFRRHERDGRVSFDYDTRVYFGRIV